MSELHLLTTLNINFFEQLFFLRFLSHLKLIIYLHGNWSAYFIWSGLISFCGGENYLRTCHCFFRNAFIRRSFYPFGSDVLVYMRTSLPFSIVHWWVGFYVGRSLFLNVLMKVIRCFLK